MKPLQPPRATKWNAMQKAYLPQVHILQQRVELGKAFSAVRRVRPRVPFWQLPAHRIPTLWSLYRGLLRNAPGENTRWWVRMFFERYRPMNSPRATRDKLLQVHKLLDSFRSARQGDDQSQKVLKRYEKMIGAKRSKDQMKAMIRKQIAWQERLRTRPIMTGGFLRPTILNGPLPRLKPQPARISMMMRKRRLVYARMGTRYQELTEQHRDIVREQQFEMQLAQKVRDKDSHETFQPTFIGEFDWKKRIFEERRLIKKRFWLAVKRATSAYPPKLVEAIKEARREKIRNKTRERERERRGEVLQRTIDRRRQGPPAHVLAKMPEWQRKVDKVIRSVSEVGFVGMMKSRMGVKMRNPDLWRELEEGKKDQWVQPSGSRKSLEGESK